jgi:uncharacterized protein YycO
MRRILIITLLHLSFFANAQKWNDFKFHTGDLLFQDLDCGDLCDAIEAVTPAINGKHFSHVGMVYVAGDSTYIVEAIGKDVHVTSLSPFMDRQLDAHGNPKVVVGRLEPAYQKLNNPAIAFALKQIGKPYDDEFIYNNGKYYCSELVYDAYKSANDDNPFFHLYPMTFKEPKTKKTFPAWKTYFKELKTKIPEGKEGCNPGSIAMSSAVKIVASFY